MTDRTAAYLFGTFFEELAKYSDVPGIKESAKKMYEESLEYDFHDDDMEAEAAMFKLGLARYVGDEYDRVTVYGPTNQEQNNELEHPPVAVVPDPLLKCG